MLQIRGAGPLGARVTTNGVEFFPGFPRCAQSLQGNAANLIALFAGDNPVRAVGGPAGGPVSRARFVLNAYAVGPGESMTIDVIKLPAGGGAPVSILAAPLVYTGGGPVIDLPLVAGGVLLVPGDLLEASRLYVAGGAPLMGSNGIFVDYAGETQPI